MVKETIAAELKREQITLTRRQKARIRFAVKTLKFRQAVLDRLIRNEAEAHRKNGAWDSKESKRKVAELAELRGNFRRRISRLGGGERGPNRASELYH